MHVSACQPGCSASAPLRQVLLTHAIASHIQHHCSASLIICCIAMFAAHLTQCCLHVQELQVLETSTPASDTHRAGFGSAAADERVPLLGFRSCDPHYAPNTPESSHRQQPLSTAGQLHTSLSQLHSHPALQDQSTSLSRQHELQQQQQQQQQQVPRGVPGADAQQGDAALQHSHHALHQEFSLSHAQDSGGVRRQAVATAQDLSCLRPDGKLLFRHVSFQVHPGQMILRETCPHVRPCFCEISHAQQGIVNEVFFHCNHETYNNYSVLLLPCKA